MGNINNNETIRKAMLFKEKENNESKNNEK